MFVAYLCTEGVTLGAHRLFTHKSFKASPLLKVILLVFQTAAGQVILIILILLIISTFCSGSTTEPNDKM